MAMIGKDYYIGLMSGTSVDAIDAGLWQFTNEKAQLVLGLEVPIGNKIRKYILNLSYEGTCSLRELGQLDTKLGHMFADATLKLINEAGISAKQVIAIGSHGQTLWHEPNGLLPFSMQIGDPNIIAQKTDIPVIADFRRADIAQGGQGAPLAPAFHQWAFQSNKHDRAIINIGGIANISFLSKDKKKPVIGYDIGPGNGLMDAWSSKHLGQKFDKHGNWAKKGTYQPKLLAKLLKEPFFQKDYPKSTGKDLFNLNWLEPQLETKLKNEDVQATLLMLTAHSIIEAISKHMSHGEVYLCGGGASNNALMECIKTHLNPKIKLEKLESLGLDPNWVESACFAWLARQSILGIPIQLASITGARKNVVLGAAYAPAGTHLIDNRSLAG